MENKICTICKVEKPASEFNRRSDRPGKFRTDCRQCCSESQRAHRQKFGYSKSASDPEKSRARRLKQKFSLSRDAYAELYNRQSGACAICGIKECDATPQRLRVDHCHTTGRIRGLLCLHCNSGLGMFRDNKVALARAMSYLSD